MYSIYPFPTGVDYAGNRQSNKYGRYAIKSYKTIIDNFFFLPGKPDFVFALISYFYQLNNDIFYSDKTNEKIELITLK